MFANDLPHNWIQPLSIANIWAMEEPTRTPKRRRLEETTHDDDEQPESETLDDDATPVELEAETDAERNWNLRSHARSLMTMTTLTKSMRDSIHHLKMCLDDMRLIPDISFDQHIAHLKKMVDTMEGMLTLYAAMRNSMIHDFDEVTYGLAEWKRNPRSGKPVWSDAGGAHEKKLEEGGAQHLKMLVNFRQGIIFTLGYFGYPKDASPFVQARLPTGWSHKKRCSKALSFQSDNAPAGSKFTLRPKALAEQAAKAWCWGWWNDVECFVWRGQSNHLGFGAQEEA